MEEHRNTNILANDTTIFLKEERRWLSRFAPLLPPILNRTHYSALSCPGRLRTVEAQLLPHFGLFERP